MEGQNPYTDQQLLERLRGNDRLAYTEIYKRYWELLYRHAFKMLRNSDISRDIVQDIFTDLWVRATELQITHSLKAYLYTMVRFKVLDAIRRDSAVEKHLESLIIFAEKADFNTDQAIIFNEFVQRLDEEVAQLPPRMQEIFRMSRFDGLSNKEIADNLSISHETVKKTITRTLRILRSKLFFFPFF